MIMSPAEFREFQKQGMGIFVAAFTEQNKTSGRCNASEV